MSFNDTSILVGYLRPNPVQTHEYLLTNLYLVVAQAQKYGATSENETHKQWFANLAF